MGSETGSNEKASSNSDRINSEQQISNDCTRKTGTPTHFENGKNSAAATLIENDERNTRK
jgi:hypothetical protein